MVISGAKLHKDICIHTMAAIELRFQNGRREDTFLTLMEQATTKNVHTILYLATVDAKIRGPWGVRKIYGASA